MLNVAIHLLRHLKEQEAADKIDSGIRVLLEKGVRTQDLGGTAFCSEFVEQLIAQF